MEDFWSLSERQLLEKLKTDRDRGLSKTEVRRRLQQHGTNSLKEKEQSSAWQVFSHQFQSPLTLILLVATIVSFAQGHLTDGIVVAVVIVLNTFIGFAQEYRAEKTIATLRQALPGQARVIRDGVEQKIPATDLVIGDVLVLEAGDRVPADARILEAKNVRANEAALTGESVPAHKRAGTLKSQTVLADRDNMLYMSTLFVDGRALAVVTATGMKTEIGHITSEVAHVKPVPTVLQRKMMVLGRYLLWAAFWLTGLVIVVGLMRGLPTSELFKIGISLLVSTVPEGLPIALTVVLSVGLLRMYKRHALIRKLAGAETLGSTTVICVDKTGTLTEGTMMVEKLLTLDQEVSVSGEGYRLSGDFTSDDKKITVKNQPSLKTMLELASLATMSTITKHDLENDKARLLTDPTETALAVVAAKAGFYAFREEGEHPELLELPFDQELRYSTSVHRFERSNRYIAKGAPERILQMSDYAISSDGGRHRLMAKSKSALEARAGEYARMGYRLVAIAYMDRPKSETIKARKLSGMTFVGYFCITDPIRSDVRQAVSKAKAAGVRVIMLTGDHILTAETIAQKVGLDLHGEVVHARDLHRYAMEHISVVARATPAEKLTIVERLQKQGEVVAMTGDGVNDAPALKKADIGIAMGRSGTDVAIEASEMVLLRDNFSAIVEAIEQGRLIWDNIRKVIFYLTSTTLAELLIIVFSLLVGLPLPLLAVQILWMNLVTDGIMSMALTVEPAHGDVMKRPPHSRGANLVDFSMVRRMLLLSGVMTVGTLLLYLSALRQGEAYAQTVALTAMVFFQLLNIFNARSQTISAFGLSLKTNPLLLVSLLAATALHLAALYLPFLQRLLGTVPLDYLTLLTIIAISASIILADEVRKTIRRWAIEWARLQIFRQEAL